MSESSIGSHLAVVGAVFVSSHRPLTCSPTGAAGWKLSLNAVFFSSDAASRTSGRLEQISDHSSPLDRTS